MNLVGRLYRRVEKLGQAPRGDRRSRDSSDIASEPVPFFNGLLCLCFVWRQLARAGLQSPQPGAASRSNHRDGA